MKRLWISAIILVLLLAVCIVGTNTTSKISADMTVTITNAKKAAESGNDDSALTLSKKAVSDWHKNHEILCTYMPHSKLEAIDQTLAALPMLCYYGATDQFTAECDRGMTQISYLNESEVPDIANIF
jgi:hypothetical protein